MKHALRLVAVAAAGLLTTSLVAGPAQAAPDDRAASWMARQLTDGQIVFPQFAEYGDPVEYGMTADTAVMLKTVGGHADELAEIREAMEADVQTWPGTGETIRGGQVAKALLTAQATGARARDFGGVNLVRLLNARISTQAPTVGRLQDKTAGADNANVVGQALAVRGLARVGSAKADDALAFLLEQQCSEGYFRLYFAADKQAPAQGCDAGDETTASADTDATALTVINLDALPKAAKTKRVRNAIASAVAWLKDAQHRNGSFTGDGWSAFPNSNSTGLAAWAMGETGSCGRASKAAAWVRKLQVRGDVPDVLAGEKGAIAFTPDDYARAQQEGITDDTEYSWRKATVDAAAGLRYLSC